MPYHSEYGQDRWLDENVFMGKRGGVFVEFGALDGIRDSNSLYFEQEKGWTGLCIEANPTAWEQLVRNRPNCQRMHAAIYDREGVANFENISGALFGWSGIQETIEPQHRDRIDKRIPDQLRQVVSVPCTTLDSALRKAGLSDIDYMSVDVEGAELTIFSVFSFHSFNIDVFGVENNFGNQAIDDLFQRNGYDKVARVGCDDIYRLRR